MIRFLNGIRLSSAILENPITETFAITMAISFFLIVPRNILVDPEGRMLGRLAVGTDLLCGFVALCLIYFFRRSLPDVLGSISNAYQLLIDGSTKDQIANPVIQVGMMLVSSTPIFFLCLLYERRAHTRTVDYPFVIWLIDIGAALALFSVSAIALSHVFGGHAT